MKSWFTLVVALATLILAPMAALAQSTGKASPFRASDYPHEVRKSLSYGPVTCRDVEGGDKVEFAADTVRRIDFNGDGRDDYVVSFADTKCSGFKSAHCGTGGCTIDFLVTLPNGRIRSLFVDQVHSYDILPGRPRKVRFWIHHSYCDGDQPRGCFKDVRITYRRFTPMRF